MSRKSGRFGSDGSLAAVSPGDNNPTRSEKESQGRKGQIVRVVSRSLPSITGFLAFRRRSPHVAPPLVACRNRITRGQRQCRYQIVLPAGRQHGGDLRQLHCRAASAEATCQPDRRPARPRSMAVSSGDNINNLACSRVEAIADTGFAVDTRPADCSEAMSRSEVHRLITKLVRELASITG